MYCGGAVDVEDPHDSCSQYINCTYIAGRRAFSLSMRRAFSSSMVII